MKFFDFKKNRPWAKDLQIVTQLGLTMAGCICFCLYVGLKIDEWLGLKGPFMALFTLLGVLGGGVVCYRQILEITPIEDKDRDNDGSP